MRGGFSLLLLAQALMWGQDVDEIRSALKERIDKKKAVAIVVGTLDENGTKIVALGPMATGGDRAVDGDTVFEIGSITKVFTSLLLADMIERGEVKADDPVSKYLPKTVKVPSRNGKEITLLDLSMQISGLPRMPNNFKPANPANPYADYTPARLYEFLSGYTLTRDIGKKYDYSNLGVGLLGHTLSLRLGMSYEEAIRTRILKPLGMTSTTITLSSEQRKRFATGYDAALKPVHEWDLDALAGAGAIRSTANDMLKFASANLGLTDTPLKAAMERMLSVSKPASASVLDIAMGWHVWKRYGTTLPWHNGGTAGFRSFLGMVPAKKSAVVVLCNTSLDIDDVGLHALEPQWALKVFKDRKEITLDAKTLEAYVGEYQLTPAFSIAVTQEGSQLFVQATGQPKFEAFAESEGEFFLKVVDAQMSFQRNVEGKVDTMVLHQGGQHSPAKRKLNGK